MDARDAKRMNATPAAPYLTEFGSGASRPALAMVSRDPSSEEAYWAARLAEAHAGGVASGKAAAMATLEPKLEEQRARFAQQLAAERAAWAARHGEKLASQLSAGLRALETKIADAAAGVLAPLLEARLCHQAVTDLRAELEVLLTKDPGLGLSIAGPEDLLQALRSQLSDTPCSVTYVASDACDLRVVADQTVLETRLAAWKARIEEAVA
jgi:hypothetical protein